MEHGFPRGTSWVPLQTEFRIAHVVMSLLITVLVCCLFQVRRRGASVAGICTWAATIVATPFLAIYVWPGRGQYGLESLGLFVLWYVLVAWLICLAGMIQSHVSISKHRKSSALRWSLTFLAALGTMAFVFLLLPDPGHPREASRRSACQQNLKNLGLTLWNYYDIHKELPASVSGNPPVSWRVRLAPIMDSDLRAIARNYDRSMTWDSPSNEPVAKIFVSAYMCPSRQLPQTDDKARVFTDYTMPVGTHTLDSAKPRGPQNIADGASNTIAIVEASGLNIVWSEPRDSNINHDLPGINLKGMRNNDSPGIMSSWHVGGANAAFADGSVRFLYQDIDPLVLKALTTANGGESVADSDR